MPPDPLFQLTFEHAPVGVAIISPSGEYLHVNRRWSEIVGWAEAEVVGKTFRDLTHPEDRADSEALIARLLAGEIPRFSAAKRYLHRDGHTIDVRVSVSLLRDDAGAPLHFLSYVEDVGERVRTERALRSAEERFRLTLDHAPIGIALVALDGTFLRVNAAWAEITGYGPEELLALRFQDITHPEDLASDLALVNQLLRGEIARYTLEKRYLHKSGRPVDVVLHVSLVRDGAGEPMHFISQIEDVTQRKLVETRLVDRERLASVGLLASGVAHEVNNPLACIVANVSMLLADLRRAVDGSVPVDPVEAIEMLEDAHGAAERVQRIVRALRTFGRGGDGRHTVVDVHDALETAITLVSAALHDRAQLVRELHPVPRVDADEPRLAQAFVNLLVNAAQAIPPGEAARNEIRVVTRTDPRGRAVIEVWDTGAGLPPSDVRRLFDPFFTTRPVGQGPGLGLSISHGIVTSVGGEISAEARTDRSGAIFRVVLPPTARVR